MIRTTKVEIKNIQRISQGDIFRNVDLIQSVSESEGNIEIHKISFPLIIVLTQDCDLEQDNRFRSEPGIPNQDKYLLSVLVAPLYNAEHVYTGEHLSELSMTMRTFDRKSNSVMNPLQNNSNPRYHYLNFPTDVAIVPSIIDFKHYFSVDVEELRRLFSEKYICSVSELHREDVSQRFTSFLARIGLP